MQNRANRGLLFGTRATGGSDQGSALSTETDALEMENQRAVEQLRGSAGSMKDIAIHIETDVSDQNRTLDRMDRRFESANTLISQTSALLADMVSDRTAPRTCVLIAIFFFTLLIVYYLIRK